jgi:parallel beta-helix repeat protein
VLVRAGNYELTEHIHIPTSGIHLVGEGTGATNLRVADGACQAAIIIGTLSPDASGEDFVTDVSVSDLSIDGNKAGNLCCETEPGAPTLTTNGISVYHAQDIQLSRVKIERARSGGITTDRDVHNLVVSNVTIRESFWDGIALYRTDASRVENSLIERNGAAAVSMDWNADGNAFSDNLFLDNGQGEQLDTSGCDNPAKPSTSPGIYLAGVSENAFSNNTISGSTNNGIEIKEGSDNPPSPSRLNSFVGNTIAGNTNHGVWMTPQCAGCFDNVGVGTRYYCNTLVDLNVSVPPEVGLTVDDYYRDVSATSGSESACP